MMDFYTRLPTLGAEVCLIGTLSIFFFFAALGLTSDGYLRADGHPPGSRDYEEHLYVNTQNLDSLENTANGGRGGRGPESPKKDIFDMSEFTGHRVMEFLRVFVLRKF